MGMFIVTGIAIWILICGILALIRFGGADESDEKDSSASTDDVDGTTKDERGKTLLNGQEIDDEVVGCSEYLWVRDGLSFRKICPESSSDESDENTVVGNTEVATLDEAKDANYEGLFSKKQCKVIGGLIGAVVALIIGFCHFSLFYMPDMAFKKLEENETIAVNYGINSVPVDVLEVIEGYRKNSIILNKEKREEFDEHFEKLQKAIERWQEIKMIMESEGSYNYGYRYEDPTPVASVEATSSGYKKNAEPNDNPGPGPNTNNGAGSQYSTLDQPTNSNHLGKEVRYRPYRVNDDVFIIRIGFTVGSIHPTDFPVYEEYQRYMLASGRAGIVTYEEYKQLMKKAHEIYFGLVDYHDIIDEIREANNEQRPADSAEEKTDGSEHQQIVMIDSNEAEASIPTPVAPPATTQDGEPIPSGPAGPWKVPDSLN